LREVNLHCRKPTLLTVSSFRHHSCYVVSLLLARGVLTLLGNADACKILIFVPRKHGRAVANDCNMQVTTHNAPLPTAEKF
jgi:hypothetical protein